MAVLGFSCSTTNLHCSTWSLYLCVLRLSCLAACGILVPRPGIRTAPPALEAWCRNHWIVKDYVNIVLKICIKIDAILFYYEMFNTYTKKETIVQQPPIYASLRLKTYQDFTLKSCFNPCLQHICFIFFPSAEPLESKFHTLCHFTPIFFSYASPQHCTFSCPTAPPSSLSNPEPNFSECLFSVGLGCVCECVCVCVGLHPQFSSVAQLCLTCCDPMNHNTPGLPVHH